jgi:hypothetical protein
VRTWVARDQPATAQADFAAASKDLGPKHFRTGPFTPKTTGKTERFIQTALSEWACAKAYPNSDERVQELPARLHRCSRHRPHGGSKAKIPISQLGLSRDTISRLHIERDESMRAPIPC